MPETWLHFLIEFAMGAVIYALKTKADAIQKDIDKGAELGERHRADETKARKEVIRDVRLELEKSARSQGERIGKLEQANTVALRKLSKLDVYLTKKLPSPPGGTPRTTLPSESDFEPSGD